MDSHKRILGILYIISGAFQIIGMIFLSTIISIIMHFIFTQPDVEAVWFMEWIVPLIRVISVAVVLFFSIPSIVGGWGILNGKPWALTLLLVMGCFKLFSFPIGTALGIYTIWVYAEDRRPVPAP
ncbi:MAG: hypothetical protein HOP08_04950 [Cyclobacteriaceae bacterium]|nr:hypothetical protein [Cyclobacteriaceae bacterium]